MDYEDFLSRKSQLDSDSGFEPTFLPDELFDFQKSLVTWALRKGRTALFEECGLGKSFQALVWAENVVRRTNRPVLILTPLVVVGQFLQEANKFGIEAHRAHKINGASIYITNYERLHHLDPKDFSGCVCDESSILKNIDGAIKSNVTEFMRMLPYRLLVTATPSPNDFIELGTSSEALGYLGAMDMMGLFFKDSRNTSNTNFHGGRFTSVHRDEQQTRWRFRGHSEEPFWRWVCSWSRALRRPSDLGFDDTNFVLPPLIEREHTVKASKPRDGYLFSLPARGLSEQREERKRTVKERCERVSEIMSDTGQPGISWCNTLAEGNLLEKLIPDSVQISGADSDDAKEEKLASFVSGQARVLVTKGIISAWGLNLQHCNHMTCFADYSFEQFYQSVRRCWRYGQTRPVTVDHIASDGQGDILKSRQRKASQAERMMNVLVKNMRDGMHIDRFGYEDVTVKVPSWLTQKGTV